MNASPTLTLARLCIPLALAAAMSCSSDPVSPPGAESAAAPWRAGGAATASADGLIVFEAHVYGTNIYTMNPDGSSPDEVTNNFPDAPQNDVHPQLSPDGSQIVFHRPTWYPVV